MSYHNHEYKRFVRMARSERFKEGFRQRFPEGACRCCGNDGTGIISCDECEPREKPVTQDVGIVIDAFEQVLE